jgi:hypothetical protein
MPNREARIKWLKRLRGGLFPKVIFRGCGQLEWHKERCTRRQLISILLPLPWKYYFINIVKRHTALDL